MPAVLKLILIIALILILIVFVYRESSGYNIVEYNIRTDKDIPGPVRFVMLSDLHDTDVTHDGNKRLLASIEELDPDFVVLAGDIITSYTKDTYEHENARAFLKGLSGRKVYYGLGNHEQRYMEEPERFKGRYEKLEQYVRSLGIELLSDRFTDISDLNIRIYGFNVPLENYRRVMPPDLVPGAIEDKFGRADKDKLNILIAHNPQFFDEYVRFGPDIVLSGHLHGGVIGIPGIGGLISPQLKLFPKYDFGTFSQNGTTMIVSRGIGWHSIPIRIFNKAEIVSVTIRPDMRGKTDGDQC